MKLQTRAQLSLDELKRRRAILKPILIVQAVGLTIGGIVSTIALLTSPAGVGVVSLLPPYVLAGVCAVAYRWSERHWYPAVYLYLFSTLILNVFGMYMFGGAQGPMTGFFAFIIFAAAMLVDLRAGIEWTIISLITYGVFAIGVPLGWINLPVEPFESAQQFIFPAFFTVNLVALSWLFQLFGRSFYQSLEQSRRLAVNLEKTTEELRERNRQSEEANRQLQTLAGAEQQRAREVQAVALEVERTAQRARALYQASQRISRLEADLSTVLSNTLQSVSTTFGFNEWWLAILDDQRTSLIPIVSSGVLMNRVDLIQEHSNSLVRSALKGETVIINKSIADPYADEWLRGFGKYIAAPIVSRNQNVGTLVFGFPSVGPDLAENEVDMAQSLASLAAIALDNNRLVEQSQQALNQLTAANRQLTTDSWTAVQRQGAGDILWISTNDNVSRESRPEITEALHSGKVVAHLLEGTDQFGVAMPIQLRGVAIGVLWLAVPRMNWHAEMQAALESIAGHAATAAENARLLLVTQERFAREHALAEATDKVRRNTEVERALETAAAELAHYLNARTITVRLTAEHSVSKGNGQ